MKRSQEPRCMTAVSYLKKKTTPYAKKDMASVSWGSQGVLYIDFLIQQRTNNSAYNSKLLKDQVKPVFRSKRRGRSVSSVCLHTSAVTTVTFEEMH